MLPPRIRRAFRLALRRPARIEADTDEEIATHLALRIERLVASGLTPTAARAEALRRFGAFDAGRAAMLVEARRRENRLTMLERLGTFRDDLRYIARQLRRTPALTTAVILAFSLGIGANATMFGVIDRLLLRPPAHVVEPERVFTMQLTRHSDRGETTTRALSFPDYLDARDHVPAFSHVAALTFPVDLPLGRGSAARRIRGTFVTASYFATLGVRPALGRFFALDEAALPNGAPVAVISYGLWQRVYGGATDVPGREIRVGDERLTIIGVLPDRFAATGLRTTDIWMPITMAPRLSFVGSFGAAVWSTSRDMSWLSVIGRLRDGATVQQAEAQATTVFRAAAAGTPNADPRARMYPESVLPLRTTSFTPDRRVASLLAAVALLVLLIACANVANLLLTRAIGRRREIAVRLALGISRERLAVQVIAESLLLAALGAAGAVIVARWGGAAMHATLLGNAAPADSVVDVRLLAFTAVAALVVGIVTGLPPALQATRVDLTRAMREGARGGGLVRTRTRVLLLLVQATLSVVLLIGTGLFAGSLRNAANVSLGVDVDRVIIGTMELDAAGFAAPASEEVFRRFEAAARTLPGAPPFAIAEAAPFSWSLGARLRIAGRDSTALPRGGNMAAVSEGYFATMGTRILRGRAFSAAERRTGARVLLVSSTLAREGWPGGDALGACVFFADSVPCSTVIGVVEDAHQAELVETDPIGLVYVPLEQGRGLARARVVLVRVPEGPPARMIEPVRRMMQTAAPNLPYADVRVMRSLLDAEMRPWRLGATMFGAFGALALLLSAVGLYSVMAYNVAQRRHEMGIRIALGAHRGSVIRLVLAEGVRIAAAGAGAGLVIAGGAARVVQPLLFEMSARNPIIYAGTAGVMLVVAGLASVIPARRATRVDPVAALRAE